MSHIMLIFVMAVFIGIPSAISTNSFISYFQKNLKEHANFLIKLSSAISLIGITILLSAILNELM